VIDFGGLGRGDPAVEVRPGWSLFDARARAAFREALGFDEATWVRGWAWMLSVSLYWLADLWDSIGGDDREGAIRSVDYIVRHRHE
jgi:aminoglycoside phosphotransferase (APT) family kinase protein